MAIKQDGKRGRPIEWGKLFEKYNRKVDYWSRTYKTVPKGRIEYLDSFQERIITAREKYGLSSEQSMKYLGQLAGLGASLPRINAYIDAAAKIGITVDLKQAAETFTPGVIRSETDIEDKIKATRIKAGLGEDWNIDDLAAAVYNGTITLNEANTVLRLKFNMPEREDRAHWISQNIFGSM